MQTLRDVICQGSPNFGFLLHDTEIIKPSDRQFEGVPDLCLSNLMDCKSSIFILPSCCCCLQQSYHYFLDDWDRQCQAATPIVLLFFSILILLCMLNTIQSQFSCPIWTESLNSFFIFSYFSDRVLRFCLGWLWTVIFLPVPPL
jgi:hypothetical protein